MKIVNGNLLELFDQNKFDIIAHGCNCFHTMGSGVAGQLKNRYPGILAVDMEYTHKGDVNKLGNYTYAFAYNIPDNRRIYNLYTQFDFGGDGKLYLNYDALTLALYKLNKAEIGKRIGLPYLIGCGLAGGNPLIVEGIIQRELKDCDVTLVKLEE